MLWSGGAGIGVNADGRFFRNHNFSRAINARDIACLNSPKSNWSNVIYQLCKYDLMITIMHRLTLCVLAESDVCTMCSWHMCMVLHYFLSTKLITDGDYIPFLDLGSTTNINQVPLMSTLDSKSGNITIPSPFPFGGSFFTSLSVSSIVLHTSPC